MKTFTKRLAVLALALLLSACAAGQAEALRARAYDKVAALLSDYCAGAGDSTARDLLLETINAELSAREAPTLIGLDCGG